MGYGLLFDPLLDYHLFTLSSSSRPKFADLSLLTLSKISRDEQTLPPPPPPLLKNRQSNQASYLAYPFPDITLLEAQSRTILTGLRIPPNILREKDPLSTEAIRVLGEIIIRVRNVVGQILRVAESLRQRYLLT